LYFATETPERESEQERVMDFELVKVGEGEVAEQEGAPLSSLKV
jgi:hypothetical protein